MFFLIFILSFLLSLIILYCMRLYLARSRLFFGDTFFHLLVIESIRENRWKFPSSLRNVIFGELDRSSNYLAYPPLLHFIVSFFPTRFYQTIAKYSGVVVLSFVSSISAIAVYNVTSNFGFAMLSCFIAILNLSAFDLTVQFTPRPLGLLFYSLIVCLAIFSPVNFFSVLAVAFLLALTSLSHKFAVQALFLGFLPYIFLFGKYYFLLSFLLGFLLSVIMSKGFYLKILGEHIKWLNFYRHRSARTNITTIFTTIFGRNIWVLLVAFLVLFSLFENGSNLLGVVPIDVVFWVFINVFLALIVSVPTLSFMGEFYRYVEYNTVTVGIAVSVFLANLRPSMLSTSLIFILSLACIFISLLTAIRLRKHLVVSKALVDSDDIISYCALKDFSLSNLLVFPGSRTLEVRYYSGLSVVHPVRGAETPYAQITHLLENYEIKYVLKFKYNDRYGLFATMANITNMRLIKDFKNFELYEVTGYNDSSLKGQKSIELSK